CASPARFVETARRRPSGLQKGCCQVPAFVMARAPLPSAAISHTRKAPLPSSAQNAKVAPSGDHQGWRDSPGRLVTWRGGEPSGCTVQMLMTLPPLREKKAMRPVDDQVGPKLQ